MAYVISDDCISCGSCEGECPVSAISMGADHYEIDANACTDCELAREYAGRGYQTGIIYKSTKKPYGIISTAFFISKFADKTESSKAYPGKFYHLKILPDQNSGLENHLIHFHIVNLARYFL